MFHASPIKSPNKTILPQSWDKRKDKHDNACLRSKRLQDLTFDNFICFKVDYPFTDIFLHNLRCVPRSWSLWNNHVRLWFFRISSVANSGCYRNNGWHFISWSNFIGQIHRLEVNIKCCLTKSWLHGPSLLISSSTDHGLPLSCESLPWQSIQRGPPSAPRQKLLLRRSSRHEGLVKPAVEEQ